MKASVSKKQKIDHFSSNHLFDDIKSCSIRGGAFTLAAQAIKFVLQVGSTILLARFLTPTDFGLIAMVTAVTGFVSLLKDAGLSMATIQRNRINHEQVSTLFWINVALSTVIMIVTAGMAWPLTVFYSEPRLFLVTFALAGTMLFGGFTVQHQALLRRQMRFKALAAIEILSMASGIITAISMSLMGFGYWSLVCMTAVTALTNAVLVWLLCDWRPGRPKLGSGVKDMLKFGTSLTTANVATFIARNCDNVLIGRTWGATAVGYYTRAYGLLLLPLRQLDGVLSAVAIPTISRLQENPQRLLRFIARTQSLTIAYVLPPIILVAIYADIVIPLILGDGWEASIPIFRILAGVSIIQSLSRFCGWILIGCGHGVTMMKLSIVGSILAVLAFAFGLPYGANGVAAALLVESVIWAPILMQVTIRTSKLTSDYRIFFPLSPCLVTVTVSLVSLGLKTMLISNTEISRFVGLSTSLVLWLIMIIMNKTLRNELQDIFQTIWGKVRNVA